VKSEVGRSSDRPHAHDDQGSNSDPKRDGAKPYLPSRMGEHDEVVAARAARGRGLRLPVRLRSTPVGRAGCGIAVAVNTGSVH
jgi:hypothetical protein